MDSLAHTVWGPPLAKGLPRFEREANLFPLEMSLDLFVYASLWQGLEDLSRADRRIAGDILGTLADITNITWTGRFRDIYSFPPEETYQYLLEAGSFISPAARHDLAFAADTGEMILRLPRPAIESCSREPGTGRKWRPGSGSTGWRSFRKAWRAPPSRSACPSPSCSSRNWSWITSSP